MIETVFGLLAVVGMILFPAVVVLGFARRGQRAAPGRPAPGRGVR